MAQALEIGHRGSPGVTDDDDGGVAVRQASATAAANASTSSGVVSHEHIQRTTHSVSSHM